jgi:transposase
LYHLRVWVREEIIEPVPLPEGSECIGEELTEVPEYTLRTLYVRRKYALAENRDVVTIELPSLALPESQADASSLSHLPTSKYRGHIPFYRQTELFE